MSSTLLPAGFFRRLGAIFYDLLILLALLMISTWLLMPFTDGQAISPGHIAYQLYLIAVCCGYYLGFWVYGGQTVGMRAWRIKLETANGGPLSWEIAVRRLIWALITLAPLGLGLWAALFSPQKQALYDKLAGTQLIKTPRQNN